MRLTAQKFSDGVLVCASILSGGMLIYSIVDHRDKWLYLESALLKWAFYYVFPFVCLVMFVAAIFFLRSEHKINLSLIIVSTVVVVYSIELILILFFTTPGDRVLGNWYAAEKQGIAFDSRTRSAVVAQLREEGQDAYTSFAAALLGGHQIPELDEYIPANLHPLSNISNAQIVECNEGDGFLVFKSDEHGFHNPKGLYDRQPIDIVAVGDSYTVGDCVQSGEGIIDHIRNAYPRTLNLGNAGGGPLTELSILKEYAEPLKPKIVLFMYNGAGDLLDLLSEKNNGRMIPNYLDPDFRQGLISRQHEVDRVLRSTNDHYQSLRENGFQRPLTLNEWKSKTLKYSVLLRKLRSRIGSLWKGSQYSDIDMEFFGTVVTKANDLVSSWGGKMYFVFLPGGWLEFIAKAAPKEYSPDIVIPFVESFNIAVIDVYTPMEEHAKHNDLKEFFPLRSVNHYNAKGYKFVSDVILDQIRKDFTKEY